MKMKIRYTVELDDGESEATSGMSYTIDDSKDIMTMVKQLIMDSEDMLEAWDEMEEEDITISEFKDRVAERDNLHRSSRREP